MCVCACSTEKYTESTGGLQYSTTMKFFLASLLTMCALLFYFLYFHTIGPTVCVYICPRAMQLHLSNSTAPGPPVTVTRLHEEELE